MLDCRVQTYTDLVKLKIPAFLSENQSFSLQPVRLEPGVAAFGPRDAVATKVVATDLTTNDVLFGDGGGSYHQLSLAAGRTKRTDMS